MRVLPILAIAGAAGLSFYLGTLRQSGTDRTTPEPSDKTVPTALEPSRGEAISNIQKIIDARPTYDRAAELELAVLGLSADELKALWDSGIDFEEGGDMDLAKQILRRLGALDPESAIVRAEEAGSKKYGFLNVALAGWATVDPDAATTWCRAQTDPRARQGGLVAVIESLGQAYPEAAVDLFLTNVADKTIPGRRWSASDFFARWAMDAPEAALGAALKIHGATKDPGAIRGALDVWAHFDGPAAASWIESNGANEITNAYEVLISGWAEADPRAAAEFALSMRDHPSFDSFPLHIVDSWVHQDFATAADWIGGIEDTNLRHEFQQLLIERSQDYVDREPALAYALANLKDNTALLDAVLLINRELAGRDPVAALAWGRENLEDPRHVALYERSILSHLSGRLPATAAGMLADFPTDHPQASVLHARAARHWVQSDPAAALDWANSLEVSMVRDEALLGLAEGWMSNDHTRAAAAEWASTFPPGPFRDQLHDRHARALMDTRDIQQAVETASSINDPFLRDETFQDILRVWYGDEIKAEAARAFIESTDLISDTVRWRVLNRRDGHP